MYCVVRRAPRVIEKTGVEEMIREIVIAVIIQIVVEIASDIIIDAAKRIIRKIAKRARRVGGRTRTEKHYYRRWARVRIRRDRDLLQKWENKPEISQVPTPVI